VQGGTKKQLDFGSAFRHDPQRAGAQPDGVTRSSGGITLPANRPDGFGKAHFGRPNHGTAGRGASYGGNLHFPARSGGG